MGSTVFVDLNDNGIYETWNAEFGAQNILVTLLDFGAVFATTTTDANGHYLFTGLYQGNYRLVQSTATYN